jgi:hypothetical protein
LTSEKQQHEEAMIVVPGRTRRTGFTVLYHELLRCYGRAIGLDGVGYWAWLASLRNRTIPELTGMAWPGERLTGRTFGIGDRRTISRLNKLLVDAGLLSIARASDVFTVAELNELTGRTKGGQQRVAIKMLSFVFTIHEPLVPAEIRTTLPSLCEQCPTARQCRSGVEITPPSGVEITPLLYKSGVEITPEQYNIQNEQQHAADAALLLSAKVAKRTANRLAKAHSHERIVAVIEASTAPGISNRPAWIVRCLDERWELDTVTEPGPTAADADAMLAVLRNAGRI